MGVLFWIFVYERISIFLLYDLFEVFVFNLKVDMVSCSKLLYFKFYIIEIKDISNLFEVDFEDVGVDVKKNYDCENLVLKRMFKVGD